MAIQTVSGNATDNAITVWAMSQSGGNIPLDSAIVKDAVGNTVEVVQLAPATDIVKPTLTPIDVSLSTATLSAGQTYSLQLVSVVGENFPITIV